MDRCSYIVQCGFGSYKFNVNLTSALSIVTTSLTHVNSKSAWKTERANKRHQNLYRTLGPVPSRFTFLYAAAVMSQKCGCEPGPGAHHISQSQGKVKSTHYCLALTTQIWTAELHGCRSATFWPNVRMAQIARMRLGISALFFFHYPPTVVIMESVQTYNIVYKEPVSVRRLGFKCRYASWRNALGFGAGSLAQKIRLRVVIWGGIWE